MALMVQQTGHDLLQGPLPIAEPETAVRWRDVELLVSQVSQEAQGVSSGRQPLEDSGNIDVLRRVVAVVRAFVTPFGVPGRCVAAGAKETGDPVTAG